MPGTSQDRPDGLRERKKARTRASIREHALRLFREQGYQRTTVEQIAAAAEVSPSTFFRYFPTKEDVVLQDDMDTRMIEALERQPPGLGPLSAVRAATREVFASYTQADLDVLRETTALTVTVPEIRARAMDEFARTISVIGEALAKRSGRPADDLAVRTTAGAIIGVIMSITMPWEGWSNDRQTIEDMFERIDQALALLEGRASAVNRGPPPWIVAGYPGIMQPRSWSRNCPEAGPPAAAAARGARQGWQPRERCRARAEHALDDAAESVIGRSRRWRGA